MRAVAQGAVRGSMAGDSQSGRTVRSLSGTEAEPDANSVHRSELECFSQCDRGRHCVMPIGVDLHAASANDRGEPDAQGTLGDTLQVMTPPSLVLAVWNARSLFMQAGRHRRPRKKMQVVSRLLSESDVVGIVECHGMEGDMATLRAESPGSAVFGTFCASAAMGGVVCVLRPHLLRRLREPPIATEVDRGRIMEITLTLPEGRIRVLITHLDPSRTIRRRRRDVEQLARRAVPRVREHTVVIGDLNIRSEMEPVWREDGVEAEVRDPLDTHLRSRMPWMTEIATDGPTHKVCRERRVISASAIDRAFASFPELDVLDAGMELRRMGSLFDPTSASDHVPIVLRMRRPTERRPSRTIPRWICEDASFGPRVMEQIREERLDDLTPLARLAHIKGSMHVVATAIRRERRARPPETDLERMALAHVGGERCVGVIGLGCVHVQATTPCMRICCKRCQAMRVAFGDC